MSSSSTPDFNKLFQENMAKLEKIKTDVEAKITEKTTFSKTVMTELQDINKRLTDVRSKLNQLRTHLLDLEGHIKTKDTEILDKGTNCAGLQTEIDRLKDELARSQDDSRRFKEEYDAKQNQLVRENTDMTKLIEQFKQRDEETKRIIQQLQKELEDEKRRFQGLIKENEDLKQQHSMLSSKIDEITQKLATLSSADTTTPGDVSRLLQQIKDIIDSLEQDVSTSTSSSSTGSSSSSSSKVQTVGDKFAVPLENIIREKINSTVWKSTTLTTNVFNGKSFEELLKMLYGKPAMTGADESKFLKAFKELVNLNAKEVTAFLIGSIFASYKIELKGNELEGGKKSRKSRKTKKIKRRRQKGGFTYSDKTKRRTFSSSPRTSSPRTSSRRSSSPLSSQSDRPKRKSKKTL